MATLATLEALGKLMRIEVPLGPHELPERILYARAPMFPRWLDETLAAKSADLGGRLSPA